MLALAAPRPVLRRQLIGLFWSRRMTAQARGSLRQSVHELQDMLARMEGGPRLIATRETLALTTDGLWVDASQPDSGPLVEGEEGAFLADLSGLDPSFDAWLTEERERRAAPRPVPPPAPRVIPRPDRPLRLGVMPPRNAEGSGLHPLAVGLAEEISGALARFRWIDCVDPVSLAQLADTPRTPHASNGHMGEGHPAWAALALDFLLEGSLSGALSGGNGGGERSSLRLSVRLLDLRDGGALAWTGRFEHAAENLFALQDRMAGEIAAQLDPELMLREGARMAARKRVDPSAYELVLRAVPAIHRLDHSSYLEAGRLLEQAVDLARDYAAAHTWLAYWHMFLVGQGWVTDRRAAMRRAGELAERAVMLDPSDARALAVLGHVRGFLYHRIEEAVALHERAIALNPNLPLALVFSGLGLSYLGQHAQGLDRIRRYRDLSPLDPHAFLYEMAMLVPMLLMGHHEDVVEGGRKALLLNPGFTSTHKVLLAALGHLGRQAEAVELLDRLLELEPDFSISTVQERTPLRREEDRAHYAEGLRKAGVAA
jgi:tetratricopeptide (TPR) repeat protein